MLAFVKLKGAQFLTYLSNLDVPCDLSNYDDELLKEYFESSMLVNIPLLEKAAMIVLFEHKGLVKEIKNAPYSSFKNNISSTLNLVNTLVKTNFKGRLILSNSGHSWHPIYE